jgi:hypothetical protein
LRLIKKKKKKKLHFSFDDDDILYLVMQVRVTCFGEETLNPKSENRNPGV